MKSFRTHLIALPVFSVIATIGIANAETGKQAPTSKTRMEKTLSPSPAELTATRCLTCHGNNQAGQQRLAPPFAMVKMHYQSLDKKTFIKTVSAWIKEPDKQKSKMPGAINRFGLMPVTGCSETEAAIIAKYVYDTDFQMPGHGGKGMRQGPGGKGRSPGKKAATNTEGGCSAGCGEGCEPDNGDALQTQGSCGNACSAGKADAKASAAEPIEKTTPTALPSPKSEVPAPMMIHLRNLENEVIAFEARASAEHVDLAKHIDHHLNQVISSCTMEGKDHDALHEWLVPFRELAKQHAESTDTTARTGNVHEMRRAFTTFHEQFEPAPQP